MPICPDSMTNCYKPFCTQYHCADRKLASDAHAELLAIHEIIMCVAECPPIKESDSYTVRGVKELAFAYLRRE